MSSRSYVLQIILWHQSLKSIHCRTLLIFQNQKNPTDLRVNTWGGGIKKHVIPPCFDIHPPPHPPPPGFTPLLNPLAKRIDATSKFTYLKKNTLTSYGLFTLIYLLFSPKMRISCYLGHLIGVTE